MIFRKRSKVIPPPVQGITLDRRSKLLDGLTLDGGTFLEIGALNAPILRQSDNTVMYLDHEDTPGLRRIYTNDPHVPLDEIVNVDFVWTGDELKTVVGDRRFNAVVASHVIEHVPDIVWWLSELGSVLVPFGSIRLAIPDKRFCFDFVRHETTIADVLAAWISRKRRPDPRDIIDFWGNYRAVDSAAAWNGDYPADTLFHTHEVPAALSRCTQALENDTYHDVHCMVCTPQSFVGIMGYLAELRLLNFGCTQIYGTAKDQSEFFVHLMRLDDAAEIAKSWHWAAWCVGRS